MKHIQVTQQEIWNQTRPLIHKSKKQYTRKEKHKLTKDGELSFICI